MVCEVGGDAGGEVLSKGSVVADASKVEEFGGEVESFGWELGGGCWFICRLSLGRLGVGVLWEAHCVILLLNQVRRV